MTEGVKGGALVLALALGAPWIALAQDAPAPPTAAPATAAPVPAPQPDIASAPLEAPAPAPAVAQPSAPVAAPPAVAAEPSAAPAEPPVVADVSAEASAAGAHPAAGGASAEAAPAAPSHDLSPWGMFMAADIVVKSVMIGLAFASLVTWTIALAKSVELLAAARSARRGLRALAAAPSLAAAEETLARAGGPVATMARAARSEAQESAGAIRAGDTEGLLPRISSHLSRIEAGAGRRLAIGTGVLATIGSTAPFVGLFGTVWGIMNSFIGISEAQTTNLAVVAPGIAEALLATALGLVAAIPAVMIYNHFARQTAAYKATLADAAAAVERLASRDLDHRRLASGAASLARAAE